MNIKLISACMLCAVSSAAQGQQTLTLQQCIDLAMTNSLDVRQKRIAVDRAEVQLQARQGALWPSLSFGTGQSVSWRPWSERYVNLSDGTMTTSTAETNYNGSYGLSATWTVWNGGRSHKQVKRARISRQQSLEDEAAERLTLQQQIAQVYVQILYQREAVEVCRRILESTRVQTDRARQMYDVGQISLADLTQMQSQQSQQEYNVANAQTQLESFRLQLRQLLEIAGPQQIDVVAPKTPDAAVTAPLPSVMAVYESALASRPEIAYNRLGVEGAEMDIDIARRGYYPTVGLSAGINTSNSSGLDRSFGEQLKRNLSNSAGINITIPIFDNRQNATNVSTARLDLESAQIALEQEQKQLYNSIETCWLNATNARAEYAFAQTNTEAMRESYRLASEQFDVGLKNIVDLNTARTNLLQAEQQLLQCRYTSILNRALLLFYQGLPLTLEN